MTLRTKELVLIITYDESRGDPETEWDWHNLLNMGPDEGASLDTSRTRVIS